MCDDARNALPTALMEQAQMDKTFETLTVDQKWLLVTLERRALMRARGMFFASGAIAGSFLTMSGLIVLLIALNAF
jgi:hypothetical protein